MEILLVLLLSYVLKRIHTATAYTAAQKTELVLGLVACFAIGRIAWTVLSFPKSLYAEEAGLKRNMSCEEIKRIFQQAQDARDPDSFTDEVPFQSEFEVLSNPLTRVRYEYYARSEDDAALKDLFASLPFYVGGLLLSYGLTCSKETIHAGKWGIVILVLLSSLEWRMKSTLPQQVEYSSFRFTVHEQVEVVKALFYPFLLLLFVFSQARFDVRQAQKQEAKNQLTAELDVNQSVLKALSDSKQISPEEINTAVQVNKQRAEELKASLMKENKPNRWRKWGTNLFIIGLIIYVFKFNNSAPTPPPSNRPSYWKQ